MPKDDKGKPSEKQFQESKINQSQQNLDSRIADRSSKTEGIFTDGSVT